MSEPRSVGGVTPAPAPAPARPGSGEREVSPGHVCSAGHRQGQASDRGDIEFEIGGGCHVTLIFDKIPLLNQGCIIFNRDS